MSEIRSLRATLREREREIAAVERDNLTLIAALETVEDERDRARELAMRAADELFLLTPMETPPVIEIVRDGKAVPWDDVRAQIDAAEESTR